MANRLFAGLPEGLPEDEPQEQGQPLPDELQGKSPQEMYQMLQEENQRMLTEQEQRLKSQAFDTEREKPQQQQGNGQQRQQHVSPPPYRPEYGGQGMPNQEESADFYSNPEGFMDQQLQKRMGPVIQSTYHSLKETNKSMFQQQVGNDEWDKYGDEIGQFVDGLSQQAQVDPRAYKTAYNYVRSLHIDEITQSKAEQLAEERVKQRLEQMGYDPTLAEGTEGNVQQRVQQAVEQGEPKQQRSSLFQRDTGTVPSGVGRQSSPARGQSTRLGPEERRMAERFGMTEQEYTDYAKFNTDIYSSMEVE